MCVVNMGQGISTCLNGEGHSHRVRHRRRSLVGVRVFFSLIWASQPPGTKLLLNVPHPPKMSQTRTLMARRQCPPQDEPFLQSTASDTSATELQHIVFTARLLLGEEYASTVSARSTAVRLGETEGLVHTIWMRLAVPIPAGSNAPFAVTFASDPWDEDLRMRTV